MSQLVQIAPGVVFSSDVLGVAWMRKHHADYGNAERSGNAHPDGQRNRTPTEKDDAIPEGQSNQLLLL
ncbi:hypothetical protein G3O06_20750 [Burkholderia sp. Ac-20345]|uniref:hypothetical protein n=1 Tax=Burkholderia sp. Ac-20345 TaxID=2703891 RepID=UPI00197C21A1|nr:hypothetical protein [Burkholderia sp. Ac-20345]MBN3779969.1 hypothetical protein [Burkholderia sp. Ac-20345]